MLPGNVEINFCRIRAERRRVAGIRHQLHTRREQRQACDERVVLFYSYISRDFHLVMSARREGTRVLVRACYTVSIFKHFLRKDMKSGPASRFGGTCINR